MNRLILIVIAILSLGLFVGCSEKEVVEPKEERSKEKEAVATKDEIVKLEKNKDDRENIAKNKDIVVDEAKTVKVEGRRVLWQHKQGDFNIRRGYRNDIINVCIEALTFFKEKNFDPTNINNIPASITKNIEELKVELEENSPDYLTDEENELLDLTCSLLDKSFSGNVEYSLERCNEIYNNLLSNSELIEKESKMVKDAKPSDEFKFHTATGSTVKSKYSRVLWNFFLKNNDRTNLECKYKDGTGTYDAIACAKDVTTDLYREDFRKHKLGITRIEQVENELNRIKIDPDSYTEEEKQLIDLSYDLATNKVEHSEFEATIERCDELYNSIMDKLDGLK